VTKPPGTYDLITAALSERSQDRVVGGSVRAGQGLFIETLGDALARRDRQVPLLRYDLRSEAPGSPLPPGPVPAGLAGRLPTDPRQYGDPRHAWPGTQ
jgi:hypothetical protein